MRRLLPLMLGVAVLSLAGCKSAPARRPQGGLIGDGLASYYGPGLHGRPTANGEKFDKNRLTAAHRTLAFNTCVRVEHIRSGRSVEVRINDRGPFSGERVIDVSEAAAVKLGMKDEGVSLVRLWHCSAEVR
jgi:rare lipoprotein A